MLMHTTGLMRDHESCLMACGLRRDWYLQYDRGTTMECDWNCTSVPYVQSGGRIGQIYDGPERWREMSKRSREIDGWQDFEIKPALIGLVQRKVFSGLFTEIPMEHIESFEKVCSFTRANGVPPDYIRCMLFPFSLDGKAARWLNSLPTGCLTSWEQSAMNSASKGDFMTQTTNGAFELIEIMATTSANKNEESDCYKKGNNSDTQKIDELTAKVDQLLKKNKSTSSAWSNLRPGRFNRRAIGKLFQLPGTGMQIHGKTLNQYDTVRNHIKRIDVQLAQTTESVKSQQGMLPGKNVMNPRVEHCNAAELRCEKYEGKELEQLSVETVPNAEERIEHSTSSKVTAPDELAETPPVRVYVPKVPYPIPPRHLMDPISAEQLAGFRKMVRRLPQNISFEHAWEIRPLHMFFKICRASQEDIKALFTEALTPSLKVLPKVDDPGKFVYPCSIAGVEFKETLCDSGSSVNLVSKAIVDELGIVDVELSLVTLAFANSSMAVPYGTIRNLHVLVGNYILHTKF
ncbi:PREDICTED: uncharacterized protein LOC106344574 [Brassica oleracea var. oleracea]|uniref:uncharacterized protein LOC106344574 n=1 Tax=Brassica oleracea var. oleracea TaxID=109376 RepID=UPI0006A71ED2|nr:PREDICTED: uncharacterized protein LOC106344574 [Brassica oleracea var. oleracea]